MQYYQLQFTPVFTVTACCNLDVQYLSSTCRIELSCQITAWMYLLNGGHFSDAIITNLLRAIDTPVKCNKTMWVTFCQSCMDFSCSKYVQFAHITISDEMQSITISNIFVLWPKPLSKGWCSFANLDILKPRKMQKLGNSTQKHIYAMPTPFLLTVSWQTWFAHHGQQINWRGNYCRVIE